MTDLTKKYLKAIEDEQKKFDEKMDLEKQKDKKLKEKYMTAIDDLKHLYLAAYPKSEKNNKDCYMCALNTTGAFLNLDFDKGEVRFSAKNEKGKTFCISLIQMSDVNKDNLTLEDLFSLEYSAILSIKELHPYKIFLDDWDEFFEYIVEKILDDIKIENDRHFQEDNDMDEKDAENETSYDVEEMIKRVLSSDPENVFLKKLLEI